MGERRGEERGRKVLAGREGAVGLASAGPAGDLGDRAHEFVGAQLLLGQEVVADDRELIGTRWMTPAEALAAHDSGDIVLIFPTVRTLVALDRFRCAADVLDHARRISQIQPILTGARKNEILLAFRAWLDLPHSALRLPDSKTGAKVIALPTSAVRLIGQIIASDPGNDRLFPPGYNPYAGWAELLTTAKIQDLRIHDLRHTYASIGLSMGRLTREEMGPLLGHKDVASTQRYAHLMAPERLQASEVIGGLIDELLLPSERAVVVANA